MYLTDDTLKKIYTDFSPRMIITELNGSRAVQYDDTLFPYIWEDARNMQLIPVLKHGGGTYPGTWVLEANGSS